ncbi:MAG TPA: hypothetical protein PLY88_04045 [Candidatus Omnitrophota bacterium]|nr:hypothetical protein [Candidatus Omnitrophota bacterium]
MEAIEYEEKRSLNAFLKVFVKGILQQILILFGRGLSLGFVLFLALSTLSLLNRGMDFLGISSNGSKSGSVKQAQTFQSPVSVSAYRVNPQPYNSGAYTRSNKTQDTRDAIRESGYFVSSVESFVRALSRFSK